ncbi:hypothetical protein BH20VER3_BH20VER3_12950 [soil metagenome]
MRTAIALLALAFLPQLGAAEPNAQMKMVLDTYASLNPVALEKSTPEAVRKAPTLADAVKAVMKKEGKSAPFTGKTQDIKVPTANGIGRASLHSGRRWAIPHHLLHSRRRVGDCRHRRL